MGMTIAVMSDLHDNIAAWELLVREVQNRNISTLINCGDTCAPAMLRAMSESFTGTIHTIFGNVVDRELEAQKVKDWSNVVHHGDRGAIDIDGRRIGFVHYPKVAEAMTTTGEFDLVCYGHDHLQRWEKRGSCFLLNPGTAGGMFQYPTFATVDLTSLTHEFIRLTL